MFPLILSITAAALLLFIAALARFKGKASRNSALSFIALLLAGSEVADSVALHNAGDPLAALRYSNFIVSLFPAAFMLYGLSYARSGPVRSLPVYWRAILASSMLFPVFALAFPAPAFFFSPDFATERVLFLGAAGYWFFIGIILYCTLSLMSLEVTFASASKSDREKIKFEFIGMSAALAVIIFYFSQGLLYRTINMNLLPVRSGVLIVASSLIAYSRLFIGNGVKVSISRYIVYRSVSLTLIGFYFIALGLAVEGMRYFDVSFGRVATIFIAFMAGVLTLFVFVSTRLRRRVKVFINKNFFAHKHDYRSQWLNFTGRLASCRTFPEVQEAILGIYRDTLGLASAYLYLISRERDRYILTASQPAAPVAPELKAATGMIDYFRTRQRVFNPLDSEYLPSREESAFIARLAPTLIVPLIGNGMVEGFIVFGEQLAPERYVYEDYDLMKTIARQAALSVINCRLTEEITETREIAAVGKISSFVIHDLKNLSSTFALTVNNAEEYIQEPEFQSDMVVTLKNSLVKMNGLIQKLRTFGTKEPRKEIEDIDLLARDAVKEAVNINGRENVIYHGAPAFSAVDAEEIRSVILNLLLNAFDALGDAGVIEVETGVNEDGAFIRVKDNGCGMTREFIEDDLFKPFRTTKKNGFGIGLYQCRQIVDAHGGRCQAESELGKGTVFTVYLPSAGEAACLTR